MRKFLFLAVLAILLVSCTPIIEVDKAKPAEEIPLKEPEEIVTKEIEKPAPEEIIAEENIIEVNEDSFSPAEKTIKKNTEIEWVKKDVRDYKIACYLGGIRIIQSSNLKEGDSFAYTFLEEGKYTCITYPYGLRNIITVEAPQPLLSPTGSAVVNENSSMKGAPFAAITLVSVVVLLFFIYGRKRKQQETFK